MNDIEVRQLDLASAEHLFESWIGFDIHGAAPNRLQEFLKARAGHLGFDSVTAYLDALPPTRPRTAEAQRLVNMVTNGLTAFWRDPQQLEVLGTLLVQLHDRYQRTLDVWCAGCATGEEAYSIAILAHQLGVPVRILATDVNTGFLDDARRAEFDDWALRRLDDERRSRYFTQRDGRWALDHEVAATVEFRHHNLLDMPPVPLGGAWDAVLCRNVMIYFTKNAVSQTLLRFAASLSADGYLLLGSSEQIGAGSLHFRVVRQGPAFVYRPNSTDPGASFPIPTMDDALEFGVSLDEDTADFLDEDAIPKLLRSAIGHSADAAIACYEAASGYDPFAAEVYALLGLTLQGVGASERALRAYGKVLFLDPNNWWAAARRAELFDLSGDDVEAHRHYRIALEGFAGTTGSPFGTTLAVGPLAGLELVRDEEREHVVRALDKLVGGHR